MLILCPPKHTSLILIFSLVFFLLLNFRNIWTTNQSYVLNWLYRKNEFEANLRVNQSSHGNYFIINVVIGTEKG